MRSHLANDSMGSASAGCVFILKSFAVRLVRVSALGHRHELQLGLLLVLALLCLTIRRANTILPTDWLRFTLGWPLDGSEQKLIA